MKTFRLIGMALLAVVMCVNFTSCSDDESDVDSNSIVGFWKIASYDDDFFGNEEVRLSFLMSGTERVN